MGLCDNISSLKAFIAFLLSAVASYVVLMLYSSMPQVIFINSIIESESQAEFEPVQVFSRGIATSIRDIPMVTNSSESVIVAIGMGISTRKMKINFKSPSDKEIMMQPFFKYLLPSFCKTCSTGYIYRFYIATDYNDPLFQVEANKKGFKKIFQNIVKNNCPKDLKADVIFIKCNHTKKPAWAQNDAMMAAYMDNNTYYYRVNDDTVMVSKNWTLKFIEVLQKYNPPNVGVVGPFFTQGNTAILTYDFVHRTHVDIFGYYYPRMFEGWHADRWISDVYKPGRMTKLKEVSIKHVESLGQRYPSHKFTKAIVNNEIKKGKRVLER